MTNDKGGNPNDEIRTRSGPRLHIGDNDVGIAATAVAYNLPLALDPSDALKLTPVQSGLRAADLSRAGGPNPRLSAGRSSSPINPPVYNNIGRAAVLLFSGRDSRRPHKLSPPSQSTDARGVYSLVMLRYGINLISAWDTIPPHKKNETLERHDPCRRRRRS